MTAINGSPQFVSLGQPGYALRAPGFIGSADLHMPVPTGARALGGGLDVGLGELDVALARAGMRTTREIDLQLQAAPAAGAAPVLRSIDLLPALELEVPDPGPDHGQVVLSVDDAGAMRWHLPVSSPQGNTRRFRIPATLPPAPPAQHGVQQRSVLGLVGRRLLKVLVYPWSDELTGWAIDRLVAGWEGQKRPHRLRRFTPQDFTAPGGAELQAADIAAMAAAGPLLLFVHGTFSTAHAAFGGLPQGTMQALFDRYGGRVLAFDHPTLSTTPTQNAGWLRDALAGQRVRADVVCHSRGGLVSRLLSERPAALGLQDAPFDVGKLVFVGAPNAGTVLTDKDHMVSMIDRLTTVLGLLPSATASETLEALVVVVKVLGRGLLTGLDGLVAMQPGGDFLRSLNAGGRSDATYCAIAANYRATDRGLRGLLSGAADNVLDLVFGDAANDLVVPTEGVYGANGSAGFPIPRDRVLLLEPPSTAMHTSMFGEPAVGQRLLEWLR